MIIVRKGMVAALRLNNPRDRQAADNDVKVAMVAMV